MAEMVLARASALPVSNRATAFNDTIALSANCCCDQSRSALAARICRGVTMASTIDTGRKIRHY